MAGDSDVVKMAGLCFFFPLSLSMKTFSLNTRVLQGAGGTGGHGDGQRSYFVLLSALLLEFCPVRKSI